MGESECHKVGINTHLKGLIGSDQHADHGGKEQVARQSIARIA